MEEEYTKRVQSRIVSLSPGAESAKLGERKRERERERGRERGEVRERKRERGR